MGFNSGFKGLKTEIRGQRPVYTCTRLPYFLSALQPWARLDLLNNQSPLISVFRLLSSETDCWVSEQIIFAVWCYQPHAQPPTWRTSVSHIVWVITLDLSGMGGSTNSIRFRQHSSRVYMTTQAPPLCQSSDTFGGGIYIYRVSQEECARLREGVPYVKVYRYNPKHLCPKLNGYGDNGQRI